MEGSVSGPSRTSSALPTSPNPASTPQESPKPEATPGDTSTPPTTPGDTLLVPSKTPTLAPPPIHHASVNNWYYPRAGTSDLPRTSIASHPHPCADVSRYQSDPGRFRRIVSPSLPSHIVDAPSCLKNLGGMGPHSYPLMVVGATTSELHSHCRSVLNRCSWWA